METSKAAEILDCPFCGEQPLLSVAKNGACVSCINDDCYVNPEILGDNRDDVISGWNTRPGGETC